MSSVQNSVTRFQDALFTATSATCVTGLIVFDTGTHWSIFGQLVILFLIQVGGLGIMTVSTAFALILGQRLTLKIENIMYNVVGSNSQINVFRLLKNIVIVTFIIESIGAALLFIAFRAHYEPVRALYLSFFHSISAFCNAGFSLFNDSFVSYVSNPIINISVSLLIIIGGLGFTVIIDLYRFFFNRDKTRRLSLHSKLVLVISSGLLLTGFFGYFVSEYYYTMSGLSLTEKIMSSWFQSVTTRTAGFNTIDTSNLSSASILLTYLLMFVGASPGSTGGGIKTTTFGVLILTVSSLLQGRKDLTVFNRKIAWSNFRESVSVITVSMFIIFTVIFLLLLTEPFQFHEVVFESISAFGTVGLSMGITAELSSIGKILITLLMYLGRIGPLTLIYAFAIRRHNRRIDFAEEKLAIG
jgi:trk system potassium uptake protein TrkH